MAVSGSGFRDSSQNDDAPAFQSSNAGASGEHRHYSAPRSRRFDREQRRVSLARQPLGLGIGSGPAQLPHVALAFLDRELAAATRVYWCRGLVSRDFCRNCKISNTPRQIMAIELPKSPELSQFVHKFAHTTIRAFPAYLRLHQRVILRPCLSQLVVSHCDLA